jgi:SAM-dependent methyltransferase
MDRNIQSKFSKKTILQGLSIIRFRFKRIYHEQIIFRFSSKEKVFNSIWKRNYWGNFESASGPGSTLEQTMNLRNSIPTFLHENSITSIFDAPCGDMNWMQEVIKRVPVRYVGGDIVAELIETNSLKYSNENVKFMKFDITRDKFPEIDLWICRAVLYHLSNYDIYLTLQNFVNSNIKFLLTTNCITGLNHVNKDIYTGDWRSLNLFLPPFNFPRNPIWEIDDFTPPHPPMKLLAYTRDQIASVLPALDAIFKK